MRSWLFNYLTCFTCRAGRLEVIRRDDVRRLKLPEGEEEILVRGVLGCAGCRARFPVLEEAARILPIEMMTREEVSVLQDAPGGCESGDAPAEINKEDREKILRSTIFKEYGNPVSGPSFRRALAEVDYQFEYADRRKYQMEIVRKKLDIDLEVIADIGGGSGGNIQAMDGVWAFRRAIVADMSPSWPRLFQTGERNISYVRTDATRLPFISRCFDLVISSFLIEHVKDWTDVMDEIIRTGRNAFIGFGPNRSFPIEVGHLDAPLVHVLPRKIGSIAAFLWGYLTRNRRSLSQINTILDGMNYLTSREYYRYCKCVGVECENIFPNLFERWAAGSTSGIRGLLGRNPVLARKFGNGFAYLGVEPNVYSLIRTLSCPTRDVGAHFE